MSLAHLYHVPYSGNIDRVSEEQAARLRVPETGEALRVYEDQMERLGSKSDYLRGPAVAAGLLVRCPADEVQSVYDAVFGFSERAKKSNIIAFPQQADYSSFLSDAFAGSADRYKVRSSFSNAVGAPRSDNQNDMVRKPDELSLDKVA